MNNWTKAVEQACHEQAENGQFTGDGEMIICYQDPDDTFRVMAEHLSQDNIEEWLINNQEAMDLIVEAIKAPALAERWLMRARTILGRDLLEDSRNEIESIARQNARQYAHDAYWDARMQEERDLG